jgi:anti-sigma regulatory factor (Ser/Thr protein kinase)
MTALGMAAKHDTGADNPPSRRALGPFPQFERKRSEGGWQAVELGGHEVISRLHLKMRPGPEAAGEGRHTLDRLEGSIDHEQLQTIKLLVTELITNSVRHGHTGDWIQLDIEIYVNAVRVQVVDQGKGFRLRGTPEPHQDRVGGWGLCLVDRLADRWGVAANGATHVWFEMDRGRPGFAAAS